MDNLKIAPTSTTPDVSFQEGLIELVGRSIPENSVDFYQVLYDWIDEYIKKPSNETEVIVKLDYFNTSSAKCILDFLRRFKKLDDAGKKVVIKWYYDEYDDDMLESGEDYQALVGFDFEFIVIEEE